MRMRNLAIVFIGLFSLTALSFIPFSRSGGSQPSTDKLFAQAGGSSGCIPYGRVVVMHSKIVKSQMTVLVNASRNYSVNKLGVVKAARSVKNTTNQWDTWINPSHVPDRFSAVHSKYEQALSKYEESMDLAINGAINANRSKVTRAARVMNEGTRRMREATTELKKLR